MTTPKFLQFHTLTSYPASLLNRDDAGLAKRIPFGGALRTRISSQCLKRHWRVHDGEWALEEIGVDLSLRSRQTFRRHVHQPLVEEHGVDPEVADEVVRHLVSEVAGGGGENLDPGQVLVLGPAEVRYLRDEIAVPAATSEEVEEGEQSPSEAVDERLAEFPAPEKNLQALANAAGLDAALFGRMITGDPLSTIEAPIHVAHAFTVHEEAAEDDYFSAVDELLKSEGQVEAGHVGSSELTSGLYYGYLVVDVRQLTANLTGCSDAGEEWREADRSLPAEVVRHLVHLAATVGPQAKAGSTAPYSWAHLMLAEAGDSQPRTLANAFLNPVRREGNVIEAAYRKLSDHLDDYDQMYAPHLSRRVAGVGPTDVLADSGIGDAVSLDELAEWSADQVAGD